MKHPIKIKRRDGIRQRYWKSFSSIPLDQSRYISLWHGTSNKNAERIMSEGLKPMKQPYNISDRPESYLTLRPGVALHHSKIGSEQEFTKRQDMTVPKKYGTVLKITIPKENLALIKPLSSRQIIMTNQSLSYQTPITNIISPKFIKKINPEKLIHKSHAIEHRMSKERDKLYP